MKRDNFFWKNAIRNAESNEAESTNELTKYVVDFCNNILEWEVWRNNTGRKGGINFGYKGSGDVIGFSSEGLFVSIEVKYGKDSAREDQINFRNRVRAAGGFATIVKTKVDFLEKVREYDSAKNS